MYTDIIKFIILIFVALMLCHCAISNPSIRKEHSEITSLVKQKQKLEKRYFLLLGHLEKYPKERKLRLDQASLKKEIMELSIKIAEHRKQLDMLLTEWENRVVGNRVEQNMIDREVRERRRFR
ncbi:MAG: hypothetical protein HQK83_10905 [Fibrobacteria bacterium]|nr:hypothetical protein [Fibrobacteria bacterium]